MDEGTGPSANTTTKVSHLHSAFHFSCFWSKWVSNLTYLISNTLRISFLLYLLVLAYLRKVLKRDFFFLKWFKTTGTHSHWFSLDKIDGIWNWNESSNIQWTKDKLGFTSLVGNSNWLKSIVLVSLCRFALASSDVWVCSPYLSCFYAISLGVVMFLPTQWQIIHGCVVP